MKHTKQHLNILMIVVLGFLLSACGNLNLAASAGAGEVTPTEPPVLLPTEPPLPTAEPVEPTATPVPPASGRILFISERDGSRNLYVMDASTGELTRLTNASSADQPSWSPDGGRVAFTATVDNNADIYLVNADGSGMQRLTDDPGRDSSPSWSPDGQWLAFESYREGVAGIHVLHLNSGTLTRLTNEGQSGSNPQWSPVDGRIAFVGSQPGINADIFVVNQDGSGLTQVTNDAPASSDPVWSPDGSQIAYRVSFGDSKQIWVVNADGTNPHSVTDIGLTGTPSWSRDGRLAFLASYSDGTNGLAIANPFDGTRQDVPVSVQPADFCYPVWSPDGVRVVFQANAGGNMELFMLIVDTGELQQLTNAPGYDGMPIWR